MSRTKVAAACIAVALLVGACKQGDQHASTDETATPAATASAASNLEPRAETGVAECDAYFRAAAACFAKADTELRDHLRESVDRYENQLEHATTDVAKQAVAVGCAAAHESLKEEPGCP